MASPKSTRDHQQLKAGQGPDAAPALLCTGPAMVPVGEASMAVLSLPTQMAKMEQRQI